MTSLSIHVAPSLLLHNAEMMEFGSNKANRAKNESITMLNQVHKTWDGGMYCMMKLFLCGKSYFILCLSCIYDDVGHHMIVILYFMVGGGHLTLQLEVISHISKRQILNQTYIIYCKKWKKPSLCGCHLEGNRWLVHLPFELLEGKQHFSGGGL